MLAETDVGQAATRIYAKQADERMIVLRSLVTSQY
jgi:hypothetical protein